MTLRFLTCLTVILFFKSSVFAQNDSTKANAILALCERIENDENLHSDRFNTNSKPTLPIGIVRKIGNTMYIICIDSAKYTTQGAFFNVYMALDLPGAGRKVAFEAKNIQFNPKGVIGGSGARLQLVSKATVSLGPNMQMIFKDDGYNFIEWDCNGYQKAGLSIDIEFNPEKIIHAIDPTKIVKASFRTEVDTLKNLLVSIPSMDPFRIKGAEDFSFQLTNLSFDRSESQNPNGISLPTQTIQTLGGNALLWNGFFAQNIEVTLPEKLSPEGGQRTTVYAQNLLIDDAGVTGTFGATNILALNSGSMSGWGFSITNLAVQFTCNHLSGGTLAGEVRVPLLNNNNFAYQASVNENQQTKVLDFNFLIQPDSTIAIEIPALSSSIKIDSSSRFEVQTVSGKFKPKAILNGQWTTTHSKGNLSGIRFQNLTLVTSAPVITAGLFSLTSTDSSGKKLMRFPISINQIGFALNTDNTLKLMVNLSLNLGESPNTFSASTGLSVFTQNTIDANGRNSLAYDRIGIDNIAFELNTTPFYMQGVIAVRENDPVFGDLFYGEIAFRLKSVMENNVNMAVGFGKLPTYKYWFVEAGLPVNIPLTPTVSISKIFGGVQNRVRSTLDNQQILAKISGSAPMPTTTVSINPIPFIPDESQGVVFRVGASYENTLKQDLLNGEAMFQVVFNPNGGFASIGLYGTAYMLVTRAERMLPDVKKVYGQLNMNYDNVNKIFDAELNGGLTVPNVASGAVNVKVHIDQQDWYVWINRPSNRAYVTIVDFLTINAYFMIGTQIDPIPPPPNAVTQLLGTSNFGGIDQAAISSGNGFAAGAGFSAPFNRQINLFGNWYGCVTADCGAGFDVTMFKVSPTAHCEGSSETIGINRWYCMGQVYGYVSASIGVKRIVDGDVKENITLIGINTAFLLQGRLPKPTYVSGALAVQFTFLTFDVGVTADVSFGNNCNILN